LDFPFERGPSIEGRFKTNKFRQGFGHLAKSVCHDANVKGLKYDLLGRLEMAVLSFGVLYPLLVFDVCWQQRASTVSTC
jgi:hypothetical protein